MCKLRCSVCRFLGGTPPSRCICVTNCFCCARLFVFLRVFSGIYVCPIQHVKYYFPCDVMLRHKVLFDRYQDTFFEQLRVGTVPKM